MHRYSVAEIFYSLQGEGVHAGRPTVFLRFAGCNQLCHFCDTDHEETAEMGTEQLLEQLQEADRGDSRRLTITGGEPLLQLDDPLIRALRKYWNWIALETNGTLALPAGLDHITVSPKTLVMTPNLERCQEWRILLGIGDYPTEPDWTMSRAAKVVSPLLNGQVCHDAASIEWCINVCLEKPTWRLSVQQHKTSFGGIR